MHRPRIWRASLVYFSLAILPWHNLITERAWFRYCPDLPFLLLSFFLSSSVLPVPKHGRSMYAVQSSSGVEYSCSSGCGSDDFCIGQGLLGTGWQVLHRSELLPVRPSLPPFGHQMGTWFSFDPSLYCWQLVFLGSLASG